MAQDVLLRMLTYTLPRFDREQTAQLETFLFQAFMGDIRKCARGIARERRRCSLLPADALAMAAPDQRADAAIEHLAERLLAEPEIHLKPIDAATLRAWLWSQRNDRAEIAATLGCAAGTAGNRLTALRGRISELADCELATP